MSEASTQPQADKRGTITWIEFPADDTARAQKFWSELYGWQFETSSGEFEYHMSNANNTGIYPSKGERGPIVYFATVDIDADIARIRELGGTAADKQEIPGVGHFATCKDPEGNPFSLYYQDIAG